MQVPPDTAVLAITIDRGTLYHADSSYYNFRNGYRWCKSANDLTFNLTAIFGPEPGVKSNRIYKLDLVADTVKADDFLWHIERECC